MVPASDMKPSSASGLPSLEINHASTGSGLCGPRQAVRGRS